MFPLKYPLKNSLIPRTPRDELAQDISDDFVAELIAKESSTRALIAKQYGCLSYLDPSFAIRFATQHFIEPKQRTIKPNVRFLKNMLRSTVTSNAPDNNVRQNKRISNYHNKHNTPSDRKRPRLSVDDGKAQYYNDNGYYSDEEHARNEHFADSPDYKNTDNKSIDTKDSKDNKGRKDKHNKDYKKDKHKKDKHKTEKHRKDTHKEKEYRKTKKSDKHKKHDV